MFGAVVSLSAAAKFNCHIIAGQIACEMELNPGNTVNFDESDNSVQCTRDGNYCLLASDIGNGKWKIAVENNNAFCV